MTESDATEDTGDYQEDVETILVKCPKCGEPFVTGDVGDMVACRECEHLFERFKHIFDPEDMPDYECVHCGRIYDEEPEQCKCQREGHFQLWDSGVNDV